MNEMFRRTIIIMMGRRKGILMGGGEDVCVFGFPRLAKCVWIHGDGGAGGDVKGKC